jgi:hypothetical protein
MTGPVVEIGSPQWVQWYTSLCQAIEFLERALEDPNRFPPNGAWSEKQLYAAQLAELKQRRIWADERQKTTGEPDAPRLSRAPERTKETEEFFQRLKDKVRAEQESEVSRQRTAQPLVRLRTRKRGAKPSQELEKARAGLRSILIEEKFADADAKTIVSEAAKRGVFCPYGPDWDSALVKRGPAVFSLISKERKHLHNFQN